jgi:hypothetical protein
MIQIIILREFASSLRFILGNVTSYMCMIVLAYHYLFNTCNIVELYIYIQKKTSKCHKILDLSRYMPTSNSLQTFLTSMYLNRYIHQTLYNRF